MFPEGFEPLSFEDNVLVARINLCCAAITLMVFAFLDSWGWPGQSAALVGTAGLIYLARQVEWVFRRLDTPREPKARPQGQPSETYLLPF